MATRLVRFILWCVATAMFRIRVEGACHIPKTGPGLLVSNHISYADAVMVGYPTRRIVRFLLWKPIYQAPLFNYFFRTLRAIPIDAASPKTTLRALKAARAELQRGELVAIFPEGSISRDGAVAPFERGFERILDGIDAPVIPMNVSGLYGHPLSCRGGGPFKSWQKLFRPVVTVRIGPPIFERVSPEELRQRVANLAPSTG
ncbi:MAG TPA: 1-acyl-sn-glycerol-3-phosphate acyltransferase [Bryobacteraceae bacterium]|jgi:1-acyl-sn-glycerol-3-phosphate acyltransferase|nr:1-acyl-sn-glycerol-3-phosphate acyltransferase [Bryobacteraceae bacterium]